MEQLLNQVMEAVIDTCSSIDQIRVRTKIINILAMYDIRPGKITSGHPDIAEKVGLYLAAKKIEGLSRLTLDGYKMDD